MKQFSLIALVVMLMSGCTQIITAPIKAVGAVAETTIGIGAAGVRAVAGSDDKDK